MWLGVDVDGPPAEYGLWTSQVTPSFPSQVFLQLRKQTFNLVTSTFLHLLVPTNLGKGFPLTQATVVLALKGCRAWLSQVGIISQAR